MNNFVYIVLTDDCVNSGAWSGIQLVTYDEQKAKDFVDNYNLTKDEFYNTMRAMENPTVVDYAKWAGDDKMKRLMLNSCMCKYFKKEIE